MTIQFLSIRNIILKFLILYCSFSYSQISFNVNIGSQGCFSSQLPTAAKNNLKLNIMSSYSTKMLFNPELNFSYSKLPYNKSVNIQGFSNSKLYLDNRIFSFSLGNQINKELKYFETNNIFLSFGFGIGLLSEPKIVIFGGNFEVFDDEIKLLDSSHLNDYKSFLYFRLKKQIKINNIKLAVSFGSQYFLNNNTNNFKIFVNNGFGKKTHNIETKLLSYNYDILIGLIF